MRKLSKEYKEAKEKTILKELAALKFKFSRHIVESMTQFIEKVEEIVGSL